ncbi:CD59A glycoprotein-like [Rhineura floridana]|uniref:CD59A glycoprotein-like n=1 Tax=Rhineura floridana TaxID=261503 RepID=UPI002AC820DC|nr:CD59A glycoprotein-like [Rhineura floridana]
MDKLNCILLTTFIILTVSCSPGYTLRCYHCEQSPHLCKMNVTCGYEEDACLQIRFVHLRTYGCWKMSQCTNKEVADHFNADSFRFLCCQRDLCNKSLNILLSTAPLAISAATVIWMTFQ